jgi:[protein-PII] uridylyltransferase
MASRAESDRVTTSRIANQRAVIDRRALGEEIAALVEAESAAKARPKVVELLRGALASGREEIARRLLAKPSAGQMCAEEQAFLVDQLVRLIHDHVISAVYPSGNRSSGERLTIMAVGGYGRGEMAPHSDVDIAFITPGKQTPWCEQVIEAMLYFLWDLALKVGQSSRSLDEMVRMAKGDLTIRTALLEGRYVWGDQALFAEAQNRFWTEVVAGTERQYVTKSWPSATNGTSDWATAAMWWSRTSKRAKAACAICTRCTGSANISTTSAARRSWLMSVC